MHSRSDDSQSKLNEVLADYFQRLDRGERVDHESFVRGHPELAEKLRDYFALEEDFAVQNDPDGENLQPPRDRMDQGYGTPEDQLNPTTDVDATIEHSTGRSRGLHIRCPHCTNPVELLADTPFEDVTCQTCGSTFNLAVREDQTAMATALQRVGRFELVSRLGVGGFGTVWKARDTELDRVVAIKIPRKGQLNEHELEQFFREARSAAQLRHPNIVPVYEVGKEEDTIFIVCALVRGVPLSDWLTGHKPDFREVCRICQTIALALHHAHEHGVIHRDMKPSNVMLDGANEPHLMDFGLAKRDIHEITMTIEGQILGTPAYMSPEQAGGRSHWTDRRTDIYSLGVMLFEMLTGEKPFRGNAQMQVHQRLTEDPPDPRKLNRHLPRDLATICLKCLERDPNRRYDNCQQIADEVDRFLNGHPILARPVSRTERLIRWCKRKPALATVAVLTTILAIAGPTAALRINAQRNRLADLVGEKDDLIQQMSAEKEANINQLSALEEDLKLYEGEANPWQIWPMQRDRGPKLQLLGEVYKAHGQAIAKRLESEALSPLDKAFGHLGLAILAEQVASQAESRKHYELAKANFEESTPTDQPEVMLAMADCNLGLSRLYEGSEKAQADEALAAASKIYQQVGEVEPEKIRYEADQLDAEMRRAVFADDSDAKNHLTQSVSLIKQIVQKWPTEPREFYELVSQIVGGAPSESVGRGRNE